MKVLKKSSFYAAILITCFACTKSEKVTSSSENAVASNDGIDRTILPIAEAEFKGKIGDYYGNSKSDYPKAVTAPKDAPNIVVIMTDDVGFGASSLYGGPIPTPNFERLAKRGITYTQFHTTALCSPTRASLITGRNHHTASTGIITEMASGFPGYNSLMSRSCGTIGQMLKYNGYNTSWFGKNHNVPDFQSSQSGPFNLWPTELGFEYFYGFIGADANQFYPAVFEGTKPVDPYIGKEGEYHFDIDLADHAVHYIEQQKALSPDKPYFVYYAPGTSHAPHHAPKEWRDKFKGKFDAGYQNIRQQTFENQKKLGIIPQNATMSTWPKEIPEWDSFDADYKKILARQMEVYAAALSHCDHQIGRILDAVEKSGQADNTIIIYIMGDNGASAEDASMHGTTNEVGTFGNGVKEDKEFLLSMLDKWGSEATYNTYSPGWAQCMNAPFPWDKKIASHFGGTSNGMVISWPKKIKDMGKRRNQFCHVIDIVPTLLEAAALPHPKMINGVEQKPIEGTSLMYTFTDSGAKTKHTTQYFEIVANRGIYHNGWYANTKPKRLPWVTIGATTKNPITDYEWELYDINNDVTQSKNIAASNPEKLKELQALFMSEAKKYNVLPIDDRYGERATPQETANRPSLTRGRNVFTYYEGLTRIPEGSAPDIKNKDFTVTADVNLQNNTNGIIMTIGGRFGGWCMILQDGVPIVAHSMTNQEAYRYTVKASKAIPAGNHTIRYEFKYDGGGTGKGGTGKIFVNDKLVATGRIDRTTPNRFSFDETLDIGEDTGTPVIDTYKVPFKFTGNIEKVVVNIKPSQLTTAQKSMKEKKERQLAFAIH